MSALNHGPARGAVTTRCRRARAATWIERTRVPDPRLPTTSEGTRSAHTRTSLAPYLSLSSSPQGPLAPTVDMSARGSLDRSYQRGPERANGAGECRQTRSHARCATAAVCAQRESQEGLSSAQPSCSCPPLDTEPRHTGPRESADHSPQNKRKKCVYRRTPSSCAHFSMHWASPTSPTSILCVRAHVRPSPALPSARRLYTEVAGGRERLVFLHPKKRKQLRPERRVAKKDRKGAQHVHLLRIRVVIRMVAARVMSTSLC